MDLNQEERLRRLNCINLGLSCSFKDKVTLIELSCFIISKIRKRTPDFKTYEFFTKMVYTEKHQYIDDYIKNLVVICDFLMAQHQPSEFSNYDFTNAKDVINQIRYILDSTLPF